MSNGAAPAPAVPITVYAHESDQPGVFVLARLECPALGVSEAHLVLEPARDRIALITPGGTAVNVILSQALAQLGQALRGEPAGMH